MKNFVAMFLSMMLFSSITYGYSGGAPDNMAGNPPGNQTCIQCHSSFGLNTGDGSLVLSGLPEGNVYTPGETYPLVLTLTDNGQSRWGFELTSLSMDNNQAGTLQVTDATNTQLSDNNGDSPDFLKQTFSGTSNNSWEFNWVAPLTGEDISFYFAGNAANNNNSTSGDYIYTDNLMLTGQTFPGIMVDVMNLEFGDVTIGQSLDMEVVVTSTGTSTLEVDGITLPDGFSVMPEQFSLMPEETQTLTVTFAPMMAMIYEGNMSISNNAGVAVEIGLNGQGINAIDPVIELMTDNINFGQVEVGSSGSHYLVIYNRGVADLAISNIVSNNEVFTVSTIELTIASEMMDSVEVTFMPIVEGEQTALLTISSNDPENSEVSVDLTGTGWVNSVDDQYQGLPREFAVQSAFPNPFNPSTTIPFSLPEAGEVKFNIYNIMGQSVYQTTQYFESGFQHYVFEPRSKNIELVSGIYFINIQYKNNVNSLKIMLLE